MGGQLKRKSNWPGHLAEFIAGHHQPFAWGQWDCALFCAASVEATTGTDLGEPYRGTYNTELGSFRALKKRGHDSVAGLMTSLFGEPVQAGMLQRGDIALYNDGHGDTVGIVAGPRIAAQGEHGIVFIHPQHCLKGWRV